MFTMYKIGQSLSCNSKIYCSVASVARRNIAEKTPLTNKSYVPLETLTIVDMCVMSMGWNSNERRKLPLKKKILTKLRVSKQEEKKRHAGLW